MRPALAAFVALMSASLPAGAKPPPEKPPQPYFDLQTIGLPAIVHGRVVNYIFVQIRMTLGVGADAVRAQDEEPYIRDALVRAATHTPFNLPENGVKLDETRLKAEAMKDAAVQLGPGKVVAAAIRTQVPQHRTGVPGAV